jgi:hypothetical protein
MKTIKWIAAFALATPLAVAPAFADDYPKNDQGQTQKRDTNDTMNENQQGQDLKMSDLPAAVRTTVQRESKGKSVSSIKKDTKNGKTVFDIQLGSGTTAQKLEISEAGNVLSRQPMHGQSGDMEHNSGTSNEPSE